MDESLATVHMPSYHMHCGYFKSEISDCGSSSPSTQFQSREKILIMPGIKTRRGSDSGSAPQGRSIKQILQTKLGIHNIISKATVKSSNEN